MKRLTNITTRCLTIFTMLLLATLTSCKKDLGTDTTPADGSPTGNPISFSTHDAFSKAVINSKTDLEQEGNSFKVFGWFEGTTPGHMFGEGGTLVTFKDEEWTYGPVRYWMNGTYDFAAVYPSTVLANYQPLSEGAAPTLTLPDYDVTAQEDLLIAFNADIDGSLGRANNPVSLKFQHALIRVNFRISQNHKKDPDNDYYVTKVILSGVKNNVTYTVSNVDENNLFNGVWDTANAGQLKSFEKTFSEVRLKNPETSEQNIEILAWGEDGLLLIPQEIDGQTMKVRVDYRYDMFGDEDANGILTFTEIEIPVPSSDDEVWEAGKRITYTIQLAKQTDIIIGTPTIEPWNTNYQTGGTVIIK